MEKEYREREYYEGEERDYEKGNYPQEDDYYGSEKADHKDESDYKEPKKSSGFLFIFLVLLIALAVGFLLGIMMFSVPQSIPSIPGVQT